MQSDCTAAIAAIWRNDFGLELRVLHGDELIESRLSRYGEAPLLLIADAVKANLIAQGWSEPPQPADRLPGGASRRLTMMVDFLGLGDLLVLVILALELLFPRRF
jgi:hypothetical protein